MELLSDVFITDNDMADLVVDQAALDLQEVHDVLGTCGMSDQATRTRFITHEGFTSLGHFSILVDDSDVTSMAARLSRRTQAEGKITLGTTIIKRLQTLVWWIRDQKKRGLPLVAANFNVDMIEDAASMQLFRSEQAHREPTVTALAVFHPDDFDAHEDAFTNLLAQTYGVIQEPLRYIVREAVVPTTFVTQEEERMYQLKLTGPSFELDNRTVYRKLKAFLIDTPGWAWIEPYDLAEDGRAAFQAWVTHYNGQGELSKRTAMAKTHLASLFYKNERSLPFETCSELLSKCFNTLHKDIDQRLSPRQKVEKLLSVIKTDNTELLAAKVYINMMYPLDFVQACNYFSAEVARVCGPAVMENQSYRRKRRISQMNSRRGRGRIGGRGGRQGRGGNNPGTINGISTSDPNRNFTSTEWNALGPEGRSTVLALRGSRGGRGGGRRGRGGGRRGRGRSGQRSQEASDRNVSSTEIVEYDPDQVTEVTDNTTRAALSERGGRNGRGFGRGAYF